MILAYIETREQNSDRFELREFVGLFEYENQATDAVNYWLSLLDLTDNYDCVRGCTVRFEDGWQRGTPHEVAALLNTDNGWRRRI